LADDVEQLQQLHPEDSFHVLVPKDPARSVVASFIDHLSLGELREAWDALTHDPDRPPSGHTAQDTLRLSLERLAAANLDHDGHVLPGDPVAALPQAVHNLRATELEVV